MKELLRSAKDFKIIPDSFKSSGAFNLLNVDNDNITAELIVENDSELKDYVPNSNVEVFGVNDFGLIYFETKIVSLENNTITLALTPDFSIIQRREYSRVGLETGIVKFKDLEEDFVIKVEDISAGGLKLTSKHSLEEDKNYDIEIILSNNMKIDCALRPVRVKKTTCNNSDAYVISGKFLNLENTDRIVLVQYAFKIKMEEQNKEN